MVTNPAAAAALVAYTIAIGALLFYRKGDARHRHSISLVAWLILVVLGSSAIEAMLYSAAVTLTETARAVLLALIIILSRGNVARLLWSEK